MNTGQMMLTIAALILLGTTVLTVNRNNLNHGTILQQTELGIYAVSLATSYMQNATSLAFDEQTVVRPALPSLASLTTTANFGCEYNHLHPLQTGQELHELAGVPSTFDDIDDYYGFNVDTTIANVDRFHVTATVYYVSANQPYSRIAGPTWLKRIDLCVNNTISRKVFEDPSVANKNGTDTIKMSYIKSYY
jgi:hypothetical protein